MVRRPPAMAMLLGSFVLEIRYTSILVKYYLGRKRGVFAHHLAQKLDLMCWQCLHARRIGRPESYPLTADLRLDLTLFRAPRAPLRPVFEGLRIASRQCEAR